MKRINTVWLVVLIVLSSNSLAGTYGGGSGTEGDPYQICTPEHMYDISWYYEDWDKHFVMTDDIDMTDYPLTCACSAGYYFGMIWSFSGVFDGAGYKILNLTIDPDEWRDYYYYDLPCLFREVKGEHAQIKNLGLENVSLTLPTGYNYRRCGSLIGTNEGVVTNCYTTGSVTVGFGTTGIGGLCGVNKGTISNCFSTVSVRLTKYPINYHLRSSNIGGLCGENIGDVLRCYTNSSVIIEKWGYWDEGIFNVGGLCGVNSGTIRECYSKGSILGESKSSRFGGLCGSNQGTISNCYSESSVSASGQLSAHEPSTIGGLCGMNYITGGIISNCYSKGRIHYPWGRGLVGYSEGSILLNCFWDTVTSGMNRSAGGTGLPTSEMQKITTFTDADWDFVGEFTNGIEDIWYIPQQDYPRLWWEGKSISIHLTPSTLNCRSQGNKVKAHLTLPEQFTFEDIDPTRPAVVHTYGIESAPVEVFMNEQENVEITAPFNRQAICSLMNDWPELFRVYGFFTDGSIFYGESGIRTNPAGLKEVSELALYWLGECEYPDWCEGMDLNRDSMINMQDFPLLLKSEVEFSGE